MDFRVFKRVEEGAFSVFQEKGLLSASFVPESLVGREREESYFASVLALGVRDGYFPSMVRVYGGPGCGKTVVVKRARARTEKSGDARKALDLVRLSGEVANERGTAVNEGCVLEALERVERDWVFELVRGLPLHSAVILGVVASLSSLRSTFSVRELYDYYRSVDFEGRDMKLVGERRVAEILTELETIGIISTWNVSRGRYGYHKLIKLNVDPRGVLDLFAGGELDFGFSIEQKR